MDVLCTGELSDFLQAKMEEVSDDALAKVEEDRGESDKLHLVQNQVDGPTQYLSFYCSF
jgi:hypothetical protein